MSRIDLGFAAYADALAGLLEDPATSTPLSVAITGPWGLAKRRWPRWWRLVCSPGQKNAAEMLRFLQAKPALGHVLDRLLRYVPATVN
jgi:hypothetical protein